MTPESRSAVYDVASVSEDKEKSRYYEDVVYNDNKGPPVGSIPTTSNISYQPGFNVKTNDNSIDSDNSIM